LLRLANIIVVVIFSILQLEGNCRDDVNHNALVVAALVIVVVVVAAAAVLAAVLVDNGYCGYCRCLCIVDGENATTTTMRFITVALVPTPPRP